MKKQHKRPIHSHRLPSGGENRRGTVLVVVMGLLGLLMLLGFAFYTFARQEQGNAEYFNAAEHVTSSEINRDIYFNWAMEQVINGGPVDLPNSALWGGRHALMTTAFGKDVYPFSGSGVHVTTNSGGFMIIDQDFDGQDDGGINFLEFNDSPAAQAGAYVAGGSAAVGDVIGRPEDVTAGTADFPLTTYWNSTTSSMRFPLPDVPYSYPDINNVALGFNGYGLDAYDFPAKVVIPSYHRPQYLRTSGVTSTDWATNTTDWQKSVMRPQARHMHIAPDGTVLGERYPQNAALFPVSAAAFPLSDPERRQGYWDGPVGRWRPTTNYQVGDMIFPSAGYAAYPPMDNLVYEATTAGNSGMNEPMWESNQSPGDTVTDGAVTWEAREFVKYDADPDGDGVKEAVYLDLDFPVQVKTDGSGTHYIPMFAVTIYDADGLLNLLAHGNINNFREFRYDRDGSGNHENDLFGDSDDSGVLERDELIHTSHLGATASEINPMWALTAPAPTSTAELQNLEQHGHFFGRDFFAAGVPSTPTEIATMETEVANMEWFMSRVGKLVYGSQETDIIDEFPGVYGEDQYLLNAAGTDPRRNSLGVNAFPKPGVTGADDNSNQYLGEYDPFTNQRALAYNRYYVYSQPLDFMGIGTAKSTAGIGRQSLVLQNPPLPATNAVGKWQQFERYLTPQGLVGWNSNVFNTDLMQNEFTQGLVDEAFEVNVDHDSANPLDDVLPLSDNVFLQMSKQDIENYSINSRVGELMSYNLRDAGNGDIAEQIRKRFTTLGWDMKNYGTNSDRTLFSNAAERSWEFNANSSGNIEFPPTFAGVSSADQPFRTELRQMLKVVPTDQNATTFPDDAVGTLSRRQRSLNLNGVTCSGDLNNQEVGYSRALTPHAENLGSAVVVPVARGTNPGHRPRLTPSMNAVTRERWARYDRQLLARDIYVMLYTLCGGEDVDYTTTSNAVISDLTVGQVDLDGDGTVEAHEIKSSRQLYNDDQLHEMAQFAINVVERLDPDNVIEKFEYDKDLSNGWNLDDDPYDVTQDTVQYDSNGNATTITNSTNQDTATAADRGIVYGVETQELTLGEVLAFNTEKVIEGGSATNLAPTYHDDREDRYFTFVELQNSAPYSTRINGQWLLEAEYTVDLAGVGVPRRRQLVLATGGSSFAVSGNGRAVVASKGNAGQPPFTDPTTNSGTQLPAHSRFEVDLDYAHPASSNSWDATDNLIPGPVAGTVIDVLAQAAGENKLLELDTSGSDPLDLTNADVLDLEDGLIEGTEDTGTWSNPTNITIRLKRRLHLERTAPTLPDPSDPIDTAYTNQDNDNPWIVVDEWDGTDVGWKTLQFQGEDDNGYDIAHAIHTEDDNKAVSRERIDRLQRNDAIGVRDYQEPTHTDPSGLSATDPMTYTAFESEGKVDQLRYHSFKDSNTRANAVLWQPHPDRDYLSVSELFQVPLYGPETLTRDLNPIGTLNFLSGANTAGVEKFVRPAQDGGDMQPGDAGVDDDGDGTTDEIDELGLGQDAKVSNRWYRLLEFFERRTPMSGEGQIREPGLMNLNGIRYPASLAGLIDDESAFNGFSPIRDGVSPTSAYMQDANAAESTTRDWWIQFLRARDGVDFALGGAILPGSPSAKPFRPLSFAGDGPNSIDYTALRELPLDADNGVPVLNRRRLFELRDSSNADAYQQYRLYSKILNNTTTRTNAFFVFVQVDFFEVVETDLTLNGNTYTLQQIGGKLPDSPAFRDFYVIDRSKAFNELRPANFDMRFEDYDPTVHDLPPTFAFWGDRNDNSPQGFNFRKLIVHREIIE